MTNVDTGSAEKHFSGLFPTIRWETAIWVLFGMVVLVTRIYLMMVRHMYFMDESVYIKLTEVMVERGLMSIWSLNPGVVILNAPWYLIFGKLPLGLDYVSRFSFFFSSVLTLTLMAIIVKRYTRNIFWVLGLLLIVLASHPFWYTWSNSTDSSYSVVLLLFLIVMSFAIRHSPLHWSWLLVSIVLAFSTTVRNDGTIVFVATTIVYIWQLWRYQMLWQRRLIVALFIWGFPILLLTGGYELAIMRQGGY